MGPAVCFWGGGSRGFAGAGEGNDSGENGGLACCQAAPPGCPRGSPARRDCCLRLCFPRPDYRDLLLLSPSDNIKILVFI